VGHDERRAATRCGLQRRSSAVLSVIHHDSSFGRTRASATRLIHHLTPPLQRRGVSYSHDFSEYSNGMTEILRHSPTLALLSEYATVPISFHGEAQYALSTENNRWLLTVSKAPPFFKDYDTLEHPTDWARMFDLTNWMMFSAIENGERIGGAIVAIKTAGIHMLEDRDDLAVLWDIRVRPESRKSGIGSRLFTEAVNWSKAQGCRELKVETQQLNVAACKFYASMGCELRDVREHQYPGLPDEVQLLWYREL
jgi:ribosomal protein S18 acetylase RimI-like enzyme